MRTKRASRVGLGCILLAALGSTSTVAATSQEGARPTRVRVAAKDSAIPDKGGEVVYHWRKVVSAGARADEQLLVETLVEDLEARGLRLDLEQLIDSEGRSYQVVADARQEREGESVTYEIKLVRYTPRVLDEAGIEQAWREAHPKATARELQEFRARRALPRAAPSTATELTADVRDWLSRARAGESLDVVVKLQETESALRLPKVASNLFNTEPAFALRQMEARLLAIEARKNELEALQAPLVGDIQRGGGQVLQQYWLLNGLRARVSREGLARLASDPRVLRVERFEAGTPDTNNLDDMREATQVVQFHSAGHEGETASGRSAVNDIFLAIIDDNIDADHPAWNDVSTGTPRLTDVWRQGLFGWSSVATSATTTPSHGTKVAGIAVADLMQGQDAAFTTTVSRDDRTGFGTEASFAFIEGAPGIIAATEKAIDLGVDVINYSVSAGYTCDLAHSTNDAADNAMLDGIFFSKSSGSNAEPSTSCNVGNPGAASGAFSVTVTDRAAVPLNTGLVTSGASHGPDALGRAVVAIAAPGGPEGATAAAVDDTYGSFGATSAAAPVVAGSAAVLKDHLLSIFSASLVNEVGFLYATMLLMGDGQMDSGVALAQEELDGTWGAGRLRMRMFNHEGMDGPWRMRLISRTLSDGELASDLYLNPDASNVNQPLPTDVERIRATVFWHEPNLEDGSALWARINSSMCNDVGYCYTSGSSVDQRQRHRIGNVAGGKTWWLKLSAYDVPPSYDSNYHYLRSERKVYVSVYWEDEDRDDADGPSSSIQ